MKVSLHLKFDDEDLRPDAMAKLYLNAGEMHSAISAVREDIIRALDCAEFERNDTWLRRLLEALPYYGDVP